MSDRSISRFVTSVLLVFVVFTSSLGAQTLSSAPPAVDTPDSQAANLEEKPFKAITRDDFFSRGFARTLLRDQQTIWSSPTRIKASDAKWLVPVAGATAFLLTKDSQITHHFDQNQSLQNKSLKVGNVGLYATWAVPGAFLALGKIRGSDRMEDTGKRGFQAAVYSTIAMQGLKLLTDRARPDAGGNGHFWNGGSSFPSGHSMEAWALAKVVSDEYSDKPLVKIGMYSFATAVSLSRITSERHFPSDVLAGGVMGYMIGKFVMRNHQVQPQ